MKRFIRRLILFVVWLGWPKWLSGVDWQDIRCAWHNSGVSTGPDYNEGAAWEYARNWLKEIL